MEGDILKKIALYLADDLADCLRLATCSKAIRAQVWPICQALYIVDLLKGIIPYSWYNERYIKKIHWHMNTPSAHLGLDWLNGQTKLDIVSKVDSTCIINQMHFRATWARSGLFRALLANGHITVLESWNNERQMAMEIYEDMRDQLNGIFLQIDLEGTPIDELALCLLLALALDDCGKKDLGMIIDKVHLVAPYLVPVILVNGPSIYEVPKAKIEPIIAAFSGHWFTYSHVRYILEETDRRLANLPDIYNEVHNQGP
jgi:hypothetical protein